MNETSRPSARQILDAVAEALYAAREPLDEQLVLVPPVYHVLLHVEAYQALQSLLPRITAQAQQRLDQELARLNAPEKVSQVAKWRTRLSGLFRRWLYADRPAQQAPEAATYERAGDTWHVDIGVTAAPDADLSYLAVETDFEVAQPTAYKGRPTVNIRRRTYVMPDGRFETVVTARPTGPARPEAWRALPPPSDQAVARLSFEDKKGRHIYYMTKAEISIGRQDQDPAVGGATPDVVLETLPDVSRQHALIRHDAATGRFAIRDVSRFGLTLDGTILPAEPGLPKDAPEAWHPLPRHAEIGLADVLFIRFEAL